jgi:hypothetical protein
MFKKVILPLVLAIVLVVCGAGSVLAYNALTFSGTITIVAGDDGQLIAQGDTLLSVELKPGDCVDKVLTLENGTDQDITVYPQVVISPDPMQNVCMELPYSVAIPAGQSVDVTACVFATVEAETGASYTFQITFPQ